MPHRHVVLTIPRSLRGLFERERSLLGLLARCGYEAVRRTFAALLDDRRAVPGMVISIQTFGSFANFHPHLHALVTDGAVRPDGTFIALPELRSGILEELFRRLVIARLHAAERLSEGFRDTLLAWPHSGFSAHAEQILEPDDTEHLERLARYVARAPMPIDAIHTGDEGEVRLATPPDPRTGEQELRRDPLDWIQATHTRSIRAPSGECEAPELTPVESPGPACHPKGRSVPATCASARRADAVRRDASQLQSACPPPAPARARGRTRGSVSLRTPSGPAMAGREKRMEGS